MKIVREFSPVKLHSKPPEHLKWAFVRFGKYYIIRGAGKIYDYDVRPRWGWEVIYEMIDRLYKVPGKGGAIGVFESIKKEFLSLYERFSSKEKGYIQILNKRGIGKILLHKYKIHKMFEIPAKKNVLEKSEDILYLNYVLRILGFDVPIYKIPNEGFLRRKMFYDTENRKIWQLAYLIISGIFGYGNQGFVVNTPLLFEEFVGKIYNGERFKGYGMIKPDFIVEGNVPLDAKYKPEVRRGDIYQAFTYAKVLESNRAILVYPKVKPDAITISDITIFVESVW